MANWQHPPVLVHPYPEGQGVPEEQLCKPGIWLGHVDIGYKNTLLTIFTIQMLNDAVYLRAATTSSLTLLTIESRRTLLSRTTARHGKLTSGTCGSLTTASLLALLAHRTAPSDGTLRAGRKSVLTIRERTTASVHTPLAGTARTRRSTC